MSRGWLRHPPRTVRPPLVCPLGAPRFASAHLALAVTPTLSAGVVVVCDRCRGGWHLVPS